MCQVCLEVFRMWPFEVLSHVDCLDERSQLKLISGHNRDFSFKPGTVHEVHKSVHLRIKTVYLRAKPIVLRQIVIV